MRQSDQHTSPESARHTFFTRHRHKLVVFVFWGMLIISYWWYTQQYQLSPWSIIDQAAALFVQRPYGPIYFIVVFTLQPLVLFPSVLMGIASGFLYGPLEGIAYTVIGANGAASVMYITGRFFGQGVLDQPQHGRLYRYAQRLRTNTFVAILTMHLIFLPFDAVNYFAGFLRVNAKAFVMATMMGALPGSITFVLFGASIEPTIGNTSMETTPTINMYTLGVSLVMISISLLLSRYIRRREQRTTSMK